MKESERKCGKRKSNISISNNQAKALAASAAARKSERNMKEK